MKNLEVVERRRRRRELLLVEFMEISYRKLKAEAIYLMLGRTRVGKGYGPVVRGPRDDENDDGSVMTYVYMYVCVCECVCICMYACMYVRMYVCMFRLKLPPPPPR